MAGFGIFVQLDQLYIEGMVHVTDLGADYFQYDETRHELRGERTGIRYQLTDRVTVQVSRVDLDARKIDLRLVQEPGIHTQLKNEARRADAEQQPRTGKGRGKSRPAEDAARPEKPARNTQGAKSGKSNKGGGAKGNGSPKGAAAKSSNTARAGSSRTASKTARKKR